MLNWALTLEPDFPETLGGSIMDGYASGVAEGKKTHGELALQEEWRG